jgi:hypothetical protein
MPNNRFDFFHGVPNDFQLRNWLADGRGIDPAPDIFSRLAAVIRVK